MSDARQRLEAALLNRYSVEREIGRGAMASVYLAHDLKHHRPVALKVLDPDFSALLGADRFLREIELTANLQHPNILPLYDSGAVDDVLFYVMPFVDGESLRQRLDREHQLPVDEALRITRAVASALQFAHGHGVLHRDVKPENILLQAGEPLVADFGIALAVREAGGQRLTETSLVVGTPRYMSPEQASAEPRLDARSDLYSLACVLYEMLAGVPPHDASSVQAAMAKVLTEQPVPLRALRRTVPEQVSDVVEVALAKLPADRFETVSEFVRCLDGAPHPRLMHLRADRPSSGADGGGWTRDRRTVALLAVLAVVSGILGLALVSGAPPAELRLHVPMAAPAGTTLSFLSSSPWGDTRRTLALSPDGRRIAFVAGGVETPALWVRDLQNGEAVRLEGTEGGYQPFFSPDGSELAFFTGSRLRKVALDEGAILDLGEFPVPFGGAWQSDGTIVVSASRGLARLSGSGGVVEWLNTGETLTRCVEPQPFEAGILCSSPWGLPFIAAVGEGRSLEIQVTGPGAEELEADLWGSTCSVTANERVFCVSPGGTLRAARISDRGIVSAEGVVARGVRTEQSLAPNAQFTVSESGVLAFVRGPAAALTQLVRLDPERGLDTLPLVADRYGALQVSGTGDRIAVVRRVFRNSELQVVEPETGRAQTVFTTDAPLGIRWLRWLPGDSALWVAVGDGAEGTALRVYPGTSRPPDTLAAGLAVMDVDGSSSRLLVAAGDGVASVPTGATPATGVPGAALQGTAGAVRAALSPDGRWMVLQVVRGSALEIHVRSHPGGDRQFKVSQADGYEPRWLGDGSVAYRTGGAVMRVPRSGDRFGTPEVLAPLPGFVDTPGVSYDIDDTGRVVFLQMNATPTASHIDLVVDGGG